MTGDKEKLLVSACLLGHCCKYNGGHNRILEEQIDALEAHYDLVTVCPEVLGGLATPRPPAERTDKGVFTVDGFNVTAEYQEGARLTLSLVRKENITRALLRSKSPSCGKGQIYDGTHTQTLVLGHGVTAETLLDAGISLYTEKELNQLL